MKEYSYKEIVKEVRTLVEEECKKPANIFGYGFWTYHILSVVKYAMSHFDEIPQLFESAFIRFKLNPEEGKQWLLAKLERDWKKLTPEARKLVRDKYKAIKLMFK